MTFLPLTRYASLAASSRAYTRPHQITQPGIGVAELAHRLLHTPAEERRTQLAALNDADVLELMIVCDLHTGSAYELWRDTPAGFAEDVLGLTLDEELRTALEAVADPDARRIAARIPRPDNHLVAAVLLAWTALVSCPRPYGDGPRVAVSIAQYRSTVSSVWSILSTLVNDARLPGQLDLGRYTWWIGHLEGPQRTMAFSTWNTTPAGMSGLDQYVAVVADADRIADPDMRATMNFLADGAYGGSRLVALGGTTKEPEEWFEGYASCDQVTFPGGRPVAGR
ncbi:hypothetical protein ACWDXD_24775 [Streptomyces sp. NPDC003314]